MSTATVFTFSDQSTTSSSDATIESGSYNNRKTELVSAVIGTSCTTIGGNAFHDCRNLTSVTIPNSVTTIGQKAFQYASSLTSITIPDSVTDIYTYAFSNCSSLTSITLPDTITGIADRVFENCTSLTNINIPDSVTGLGDYAFFGSGLTTITIPDSVTTISNATFASCNSLKSMVFTDDASNITSLDGDIFSGTNSISDRTITFYNTTTDSDINSSLLGQVQTITTNDTVYLYGDTATGAQIFYNPNPYNTTFTFNDGTTISVTTQTIDSNSYNNNTIGLVSVVIGTSCTSIGSYAFYNCTSLDNVTITNSVTTIGSFAFRNCTSLTNISIGNSVTTIGSYAFRDCTSLDNVTIPNSVTTIANNAFKSCTSLDNVTIPNSVTTIGQYAFEYCTSLTSITIPNSVTTIGKSVFFNCTSLTKIEVDFGNQYYSNNNSDVVLYNKDITTLIQYPIGNSATDFTIPDSVTSIDSAVFRSCTSLTSISIGNSVTSIGSNAFAICTSLTSITIPDSVTTIDSWAFFNCTSLPSITIPDSVKSIGHGTFRDCTSLTEIVVDPNNPNYSNNNSDGVLYNKDITTLIQYPSKKSDTDFYTPSSVTNIDSYAFANSSILTTVTIPDSAISISIGNNAFKSCNSLVRIVFRGSTSTMSIGTNLFSGVSANDTRQIIFYNAIFYNTTENDIQSSLLSQVQTITTDDTVYFYNDSTTTAQIFIYPRTNPISNICFPAGTPITCNQGNILIEKINPDIHTIRNKKIVGITKTVTQDKYLVYFKKDALGNNIPSQKTIISNNHRILYKGNMIKAEKFIGINDKVYKIKYRNEILYNVLMEEHDKMVVNNLICETLNPENGTAKLYKYLQKFNPDEVTDLINIYNKYVIKNKIYSSKK